MWSWKVLCRGVQLNAPPCILFVFIALLFDFDYPVNMVRHNLKHIHLRARKMFRYLPPTRLNNTPGLPQSHLSSDNLTENAPAVYGTNGDEIPSG